MLSLQKIGEQMTWTETVRGKIEKLKAAITSTIPPKPKGLLEAEDLHRRLSDELGPLQTVRSQMGQKHMAQGAAHADAAYEAHMVVMKQKEEEIRVAFDKRRALQEKHSPAVLKAMGGHEQEGEALFDELFSLIGELAAVYEEGARQAGRNGVDVTHQMHLWRRAPQLAQIARQGQFLIKLR